MLFLKRDIRTRIDLHLPEFKIKIQDKLRRDNFEFRDRKFDVGDRVDVRVYRAANTRWKFGTIVNQDGVLHYIIDVQRTLVRRHVDQIRPVGDQVLYAKFKRTGSVEDDKKAMATVTDGAKQVVDFFAADPTRSVRRAAEMLRIKRTSLQRIMRARMVALQNSNEAYFTLDGHLNKQNYRYWGRERPEITVVRSLHPKKFLVWCAISSHGVFGPIFIDGTLSAANYRKFLDEEFIPFLQGHDLVQGHWFMQDGARPHRTADVFEVLNEHFSDRIIGLDYPSHFQGRIEWPPYSPDLNPCNYYLWGYLKSKVWQTSPTNLPELKTAITTAVNTIDSEACSRVMVGFQNRLTAVLVKMAGTSNLFIINCPICPFNKRH
ncbi:t-complex protein 1 subunit delta [Trichonephila clavata]|uniref:T-complex protein 1 subunit delta n=1 Tax=Trichonephila clavata TaxID=2740835 RepID=A0A8X6LGA2_TRICU|nr:t-complex protein 1 subunit delta [Trichonephila clavata]